MYENQAVPSETRKESATERELKMLAEAVATMYGSVDRLENRLTSILMPESPDKSASNGTPEEMLSQVPSEIRSSRKSIESALYRLKSIMNRIEV